MVIWFWCLNCREKSYPRNSSCPLVIILDCVYNFFFYAFTLLDILVQSSFIETLAHIRNLISALNTFFSPLTLYFIFKNFSLTSFVTLPAFFVQVQFSLCSNICDVFFFSVRVSDAWMISSTRILSGNNILLAFEILFLFLNSVVSPCKENFMLLFSFGLVFIWTKSNIISFLHVCLSAKVDY